MGWDCLSWLTEVGSYILWAPHSILLGCWLLPCNSWHCSSSDDRSPEAFRTRIEAATQMESVLGAGGRPNCLVIDEIDGAPTVGLCSLGGWAGWVRWALAH